MLNFFVKRPVTTIMFVLFFVVLGIVSYPKMNVENYPSVDFPMVTATFIYPGASPDEIESQIIERAEDAMSEVAGIKKVTSRAFESGGYVMVEFHLGMDANEKSSEIKTKIEAISDFPDDMEKPVVEKLNPLQQSVVDIVLTGANGRDMVEFVDDVLAQRLTALPGIASVDVFGGEKRAIRVELDPERMASYGLSIMETVGALGAYNLNVPGGKIEGRANSTVVRFTGEFQSVDDIKNLPLTTAEGSSLVLSDIATITDGALDIENGARFNGDNVVIVSVIKASDGNAVKISKLINKNFDSFNREFNSYIEQKSAAHIAEAGASPAQPEMKIVSDTSTTVQDEVNGTIWGVIMGIILTIGILLYFTRNWRSTIIASVVIPASLVAGFFFMDFSGFTINMMTLLAMASALGTLITNAITLIESALGLLDAGYTPEDAAIEGTKKVLVAVLASTGTNIMVFLPIAFMGGIAGQFMQQFGMTVVYLTIMSLVFSLTLTPMMIAKFLRRTKIGKKQYVKENKEPLKWFKRVYNYQFLHPWKMIGGAFLVLILSAGLMNFVGNEFAPSSDVDEINITMRAPSGSTYEKTAGMATELESRLTKFSDIQDITVKIGDGGTNNASVKLKLKPKANRRESDKQIARKILPHISDIPDAEIQIKAGEGMSSSDNNDMVLNVSGDNDEIRNAYADHLINVINEIPEIQSAVLADQKPGAEYTFVPDNAKTRMWGIPNQSAGIALRTALFGNDDFKYKENGNEYPILMEFAREFKTREIFDNVYVNSYKGLVPLSEIGDVKTVDASPNIRRIDKERVTEIDINIGKSTLGPVQQKIQAEIDKIDFQAGYGAKFGGMSEMQDESNTEMMTAFILAAVLTFMLLAAILNSLVHPFTVWVSIITSFAGVFIFMFLSGASLNIAALLSIIMLVGLAVNNNILLLEPVVGAVEKGADAKKTLWLNFVDKKRMMLMTTIAVASGMIPQLFDANGTKVAMAAVIIGGILASLFWTYFLTPAVFVVMERFRTRRSKRKAKNI